jgi:hypothetical protein
MDCVERERELYRWSLGGLPGRMGGLMISSLPTPRSPLPSALIACLLPGDAEAPPRTGLPHRGADAQERRSRVRRGSSEGERVS